MIPDWLTTTPRRQQAPAGTRRPPTTVTPSPTPALTSIHSRNQYSALAAPAGPPEVPDKASAQPDGENNSKPDADSIGSLQTDWDSADEMSANDKDTDSLVTHMGQDTENTPIDDPTLMDIIKYRNQLATALTKCSMDKYFGGYVFIIMNDEEEYQNRIGDHKKEHKLPGIPMRPKEPEEPTRAALFKHSNQKKKYKEYLKYNQEAVDLIELKFPDGLNGLKDEAGNLPIQLKAKAALEHITNNIVSEPAKDHSKILQSLLTRTYEPNAKGAEDYFTKADGDRLMVKHLGFPYIPYSMIMSSAQAAFANSTYDSDLIHKIDTEWNAKLATHQEYQDTDSRKCYMAFKTHYNKELKILYKHKPPANRRGSAHRARDIDQDWKEQVEGSVFELHSALNAIKNSQKPPATVPTEAICIPTGTASTGAMSATTFITMDQMQQTENRLMDFMKQTLGNNGTNNPHTAPPGSNGGRGTTRRQAYMPYSFWCYSCGCNISHNTAQCKTKSRPGHLEHMTATIDNPQGGNTTRDDRYGKFNGPRGVIVDSIPPGN